MAKLKKTLSNIGGGGMFNYTLKQYEENLAWREEERR